MEPASLRAESHGLKAYFERRAGGDVEVGDGKGRPSCKYSRGF